MARTYWLGSRLRGTQTDVRRTQDRLRELILERAADAHREGDHELARDLIHATAVMRHRVPRRAWASLATRDDEGLQQIVNIMAGGSTPERRA